MALLIVKEHICPKSSQKIPFRQPSQKQAFIKTDIPVPQCPYHPLVSRRSTGRHQGGPDWAGRHGKAGLQLMQCRQEGFERPSVQRLTGRTFLVFGKGFQSITLENLFRLIGKQHGIAVKGDPKNAIRALALPTGKDRRGSVTGFQHLLHIIRIGREEQMGAECRNIAVRALPPQQRRRG